MTHRALRGGTLGINGIRMVSGRELQYSKEPEGTGGKLPKVSRDAWEKWNHPNAIQVLNWVLIRSNESCTF